MLYAAVAAILVATVFAQLEEGVQAAARYYYDQFQQRKARIEEVDANNTQAYYHVIELFAEGVYYEINLQTNVCIKGKLNGPFIPHGVVPNSTFDGNYFIGSSSFLGSGLEIQAWNTNITTPQGIIQWFATFTSYGCFPIRDQFVLTDSSFFVEEFYDLVAGITDPNVFIPPTSCP